MEYTSPVIIFISLREGDVITTSPSYDGKTETPPTSLGGGEWGW